MLMRDFRWEPQGTARRMCNSFGASLWMLPLSEHSYSRNLGKPNCRKDNRDLTHHFAWPVDVAEIHIPKDHGKFQKPKVTWE